MIDWIKDLSDGEGAEWKSVNTSINTFGQELSLRMDFPELLKSPGFFIRNFFAGYSHISQDKPLGESIQSKYALEYLRHKVTLGADVRLGSRVALNLAYRYCDRVGNYVVYENGSPSGVSARYKPYSTADMRLSYFSGMYSFFCEVDNVLNVKYFDYGNIPQPGIVFRVGMKIDCEL